jgi:hypothetical protein
MSHESFTLQHFALGRTTAWLVFILSVLYAVITGFGFLSLKSPTDPIGDPYFSLMELLIILVASLMVVSNRLKEKKVIIFAVGASPFNEKAIEELEKRNLSEALVQIPLFYCRGAWHESAMTTQDRLLCRMLKKTVSKKAPALYEPWEAALMETTESDSDWTDKLFLNPIIEYARATLSRK